MRSKHMNRPGGWSGIFPKVLNAGVAGLGCVLALVAIVGLASWNRRVVLVDTRPIQSVNPPFTYENDQRRFMGLVVMPVCPETPGSLSAVGRICTAMEEGVRVELRGGLIAGKDGTAVAATGLAHGLEKFLEGYTVTAEGNALSIAQKPGQSGQPTVPPSLIVPWLRVEPAVVALQGQSAPVGTGPFYIDELWCHEARVNVQCSRTGGSPPVGFGELDEWLEDVLVLRRRRDWSGRATTEIVVVGLRGEKDDKVSTSVPRTSALVQALDRGDVHGVFDIEADLEAKLQKVSGGRPKGWRLSEPRQDRVLVAALRPSDPEGENQQAPARCETRLVQALAKIRRDPTFLRRIGARPAAQLLPEPFESVHTWQNPIFVPGVQPIDSSERCRIDLVTNTAWTYAADEISHRLRRLDVGLDVLVRALPPAEENDRRNARNYDVSLLALVYSPRPDAYYLWDNLRSTGWASGLHLQATADLAAREAKGEDPEVVYSAIDRLHRDLDAYLIPMGAPTRVVATSDRLLGLDPGGWYIDPDSLRLSPSASEFRVRSGLLTAGVVLIVLAAASHFSRRASDRRKRVELSLRTLRHDLLAPLATIKANAERVLAREPKIGEALLSEAEAALAVAEDARFVVREGKPQAEGNASTRLRDEVVEPILETLKRRSSYETGEEPTIMLALPDELPPVAMPPDAARFVVRTLVENAWRHRGDRPLVLELAGAVSGGSLHLDVKDHGPGMSTEDAENLFQADRPDRERPDYKRGSGIGLHLAWSVLRLCGGDIWLSRTADPTIFTVRFPLAPARRTKSAKPPAKETP